MSNTEPNRRENRPEQVMNYQSEKLTPPARVSAPLSTANRPNTAPMYSSTWLALYSHVRANRNQNSAA
jgi:hypothetical protein